MPPATTAHPPHGGVHNQNGVHKSHSTDLGSIPSHPLGVKPLGNRFLRAGSCARGSTGSWTTLPDELLMMVLEHLGKLDLLALGSTCRFFYAFCRSEELWKALFLSSDKASQGAVKWRGSWRSTLLAMPDDSGSEGVVDCSNVFSDVLHRPFACRNIVLSRYAAHIPMANRIHRFEDLSHVEFARKWTTQPFILTNCIQEWPVYREWTIEALLGRHSDANFRAEAVDWPLSTYCDYMNSNQDESPLYLFDRKFAEKMGLRVGQAPDAAYWRPECFGPDLFEVLGHERPAHRWLIIGPERSGSTFHKDPNATSAWNAVIRGSKYWIMFPPHVQVPGVYVSSDSSEVTSPLSIAEWLLAFHEEARQVPGCVEALCKTGEILHVPSGWWHLVVNMEQGIALTQNFVPQSPGQRQLSEALLFLRDKPDQVSGFQPEVEDPYGLFVAGLEAHHPGLLAEAMQVVDRKGGRKRRWDAAVGARDEGVAEADAEDGGRGGFTFGFGAVDAGEIP